MKIGFIGMGNMAQAIAAGFIYSDKVDGADVYAYAPHQDKLKSNAAKIGFVPAPTPKALVKSVDVVVIACKPYQVEEVLEELKEELKDKALISIAAGWTHEKYAKLLGSETRIQCVMPNTPAMVGEGVLLFERVNSLKEDERSELIDLFGSLGLVEELPTELMNIGTAITGCGPAFMDMIMEAYADAAVKYGIPRTLAYKFVSQTMLGSAKLQLQSGSHPGVLKDAVCSPAGSTIRGVEALEVNGLRAACMKSVDAVVDFQEKRK
ncbi:MAG: pyrroline-5-carboxylate reductase [Lachnospiraceae bacterium]|jgi:pyrroline-5-carboxylate reductase|nr:pyrroline-5-carboxylate reductase [Lachnospiraceae bacterium]